MNGGVEHDEYECMKNVDVIFDAFVCLLSVFSQWRPHPTGRWWTACTFNNYSCGYFAVTLVHDTVLFMQLSKPPTAPESA